MCLRDWKSAGPDRTRWYLAKISRLYYEAYQEDKKFAWALSWRRPFHRLRIKLRMSYALHYAEYYSDKLEELVGSKTKLDHAELVSRAQILASAGREDGARYAAKLAQSAR